MTEAGIDPMTSTLGGEYGNHSATATALPMAENYGTSTSWNRYTVLVQGSGAYPTRDSAGARWYLRREYRSLQEISDSAAACRKAPSFLRDL